MRGSLGGLRFTCCGGGGGRLGWRFVCSWLLPRDGFACHRALSVLFSVGDVEENIARTAAFGSCRRTSAADKRPELRAVRVRFLCVR